MKVEGVGLPERQVAASVIGEAVFWAAGYNASCEQGLYVRPSIFKLMPGLRAKKGNFGDEYDFDQAALDAMLAKSSHHGELVRISASSWVPGYGLGQFRYEGTREDDPNDVIPHEDRRELRGARLLAAWIDHFDMREGNSLDTWMTDVKGGPPDASPGHVVHYQIGTSAALGSLWDFEPISRRLGSSYVFDWADFAKDLVTFGALAHPWDVAAKTPGHEIFGYMNIQDFDPQAWKNEYPNKAFSRMTERDGAWMARILARFTPALVVKLARMGKMTDPANTAYLAALLEGRLERILDRYLLRVSPITDLRVTAQGELCGTDVAEWRHVRGPASFHYAARTSHGAPLPIARHANGEVCVGLRHIAGDGGARDDAEERYLRVVIADGVARGPLVAHLYDLGPARGYKLVGIERPAR